MDYLCREVLSKKFLLILMISLQTIIAERTIKIKYIHSRQSRSLVFPPTAPTRLQFIGGIGLPALNLHLGSVTSGYVLKAEYLLPERADHFHQNIKPLSIHGRSVNNRFRQITNNTAEHKNVYTALHTGDNFENQHQQNVFAHRWIFYAAIEMILERWSLNGRICFLRSICEYAAQPIDEESGDLLSQILHIILTPSMTSSNDAISPKAFIYLDAEIIGRRGGYCEKVYNKCKKSLMDMISIVFNHDS
uniref:Uncharacterized protein n=1 Tax=Glossina brevipalpis TaxID=37001 RepID=A0A1A9WA81_9MUSC